MPRNPWSRIFLALKAGLAAGAALLIDHLTGNPDHVSSTFIAVVCVSPVVLIGLERARDQVMGSAVGGGFGTLAALAGLPLEIGIPAAVSAGVLMCFVLGFGEGYLLASFAALFVQAVPFGEPLSTLGVRALAVGTGAIAGLLINTGVSAFAYRSIFTRRLHFAEATVSRLLVRAVEEGPHVAGEGSPYLTGLCKEMDRAARELRWRGKPAPWIASMVERLEGLRRVLHLVADLGDLVHSYDLEVTEVTTELAEMLEGPGGESPTGPELKPTFTRLRDLNHQLTNGRGFLTLPSHDR